MATDPRTQASPAFEAHAGAVARFARRMGIASCELDDIVQDVFLAAHDSGGFRPGMASERTWYLRLTWYAVVRQRRRAACAPAPLEAEPITGPQQERTLEMREQLARVSVALDRLSDAHRAVLVLFEIEGYAAEEIASALQIPIGTVHSRLHHARRRFADALVPRPARIPGGATLAEEGST